MKRLVIAGSIFVIGAIVGAASVLFFRIETWQAFADRYVADAAEQIQIAQQIRSGRGEELTKKVDNQMPTILRTIASNPEFRRSPLADDVLWHAREYHLKNNIAIPDDIKPELDKLPIDHPASCELPRNQDAHK